MNDHAQCAPLCGETPSKRSRGKGITRQVERPTEPVAWRVVDDRKMYDGMVTADPKVRDVWLEAGLRVDELCAVIKGERETAEGWGWNDGLPIPSAESK